MIPIFEHEYKMNINKNTYFIVGFLFGISIASTTGLLSWNYHFKELHTEVKEAQSRADAEFVKYSELNRMNREIRCER